MILKCDSCHKEFDESEMDYFGGPYGINLCKPCNRKSKSLYMG